MTNPEPPDREVRQPAPGVDIERPPDPIEAPEDTIDEAIDEELGSSDPPSFTSPAPDPAPQNPNVPSTGLPSDAPGG